MGKDIRTRAGLNPDRDDTIPYSIDTRRVEEFLQKKMDILVKKVGEKEGTPVEPVDIKVFSTEAGSKFIPFMIVLPVSVAKDFRRKQKNVPEVFRTHDDNDNVRLQDHVYAFLQQYAYTKDDAKMFDSQSFRQQMGIYRKSAITLRSLTTPKKMNNLGRKDPKIIMLLDPLKVFYDMLGSEDDTRPYHVDVCNWKKIETGNFKYNIERVINRGKNKKYKDTIASELNNYLRGGRR